MGQSDGKIRMTFPRKRKYKSDGKSHERAKRCHACLDCRYYQTDIFKECPECGSKNRQYFMSDAEHKRGMMLLTLLAAGTISDLRFQVKYDLEVNGHTLTDHKGKPITYTPDAVYTKNGVTVYEDTKTGSFIEDLSRLKIAVFEASKGIKVHIPK